MDTSAASYTPADRVTARPRLREGLLHLSACGLTVAVLLAGLRLDRADWHAPFGYDQDALLILPMVKETVARAAPWSADRLGAPGRQELHDFPVVDHLHFAVIWLLGRAFPDPVVVFNLFHLLTYPLATAAALFVLRRLGLSAPAALCGAILYSFQPYHWLRGTAHYFLAAYYVVPLTLWVTLELCRGRLPGFGDRRWTAVAVVIALLTALAGAYYAFFACVLLAVAGLYGWAAGFGWRAAAAAGLVVGVVVVGGLAAHAPAIPYRMAHGANSAVTRRPAEDAELYALKVAQLVLPVANHNPVGLGPVPLFEPAVVRSMYQAPQIKPLNESDWSPLGLVGACGFVALLAAGVLPVKKGWPVGPCAALTLAGVLFATHGGFGAVFNLLVTAQVRCHNRMSIYLAFLALFAACRCLDRLVRGWWKWPAFLALIGFGVWDQTDTSWFPDLRRADPAYKSAADLRADTAAKWWADRAFFERVEELIPEGAVFTYPYMAFPEGPPFHEKGSPGKTESYEMVKGYLHTRRLRWSYGAMKYRAVDGWMRAVAMAEPPPRMLERLVLAGFDGLLVDKKGLDPKRFDALRAGIDQVLGQGSPRLTHPDGRLVVFDLRPYRAYLSATYGPARLDALAAAEREAVSVLWLGGFSSYEPTGYEWRGHWGGPAGELVFVNPTDRTRPFEMSCRLLTAFSDKATLTFAGGDFWADELVIDGAARGQPYRRRLEVPPGTTRVKVTCRPWVTVLFTDSRRHLFTVLDFRLAEQP